MSFDDIFVPLLLRELEDRADDDNDEGEEA